jgi:hypothetical protein
VKERKLGKCRAGKQWAWCIFTVDVTSWDITVRALMPEYHMQRWHVTRESLYLVPVHFSEVVNYMGDWLRKAVEVSESPEGAVHFRDAEFEKEYPALYDFLASKIGPNGKPRESACLLVFARDNEVTCCLKDRGLKRAFYGRSDGVLAALKALEAELRNG